METQQQRRIREIVDGPGEPADTSLQRQAQRRADDTYVPRTMTPHEWEQWYAEHGVPREHLQPGATVKPGKPLWHRLLAKWMPGRRD